MGPPTVETARVVLAFAALVLWPGYLIARRLVPPQAAPWGRLPWSLAFAVASMALLATAADAAGLSFRAACLAWIGATALLTLDRLRARPRARRGNAALGVAGALPAVRPARLAALDAGAWLIGLAATIAAAYSGPWLVRTADIFYHLAAVAAILRDGTPLSHRIFFPEPVRFADPTVGGWHFVIALVASVANVDPTAVAIGLTPAIALLGVLALATAGALMTGDRWIGLLAVALYLLVERAFDFRRAIYSNELGPLVAWMALGLLATRGTASSAAERWGRAISPVLLCSGAVAIHSGTFGLLFLATVGLAFIGLVASGRAGWPNARDALIAISSAAVIFAWRGIALTPLGGIVPSESGLDATLPHVVLAGLPIWQPALWYPRLLAPATLALLAIPLLWRAARHGAPGMALLLGLLVVPIGFIVLPAVVPPLANATGYLVLRTGQLLPFASYVGWALVAAGLVRAARVDLLTQVWRDLEANRGSGWQMSRIGARVGLVSVGVASILAALPTIETLASIYSPRSVSELAAFRTAPRRVLPAWESELAAIRDLPAESVVLAEPDTAYRVSGLTGSWTVAVPLSHTPAQVEGRNGKQRRVAALDATAMIDGAERAVGLLEAFGVSHVLVEREANPIAWERLRDVPFLPVTASGPDWRLHAYDRAELATAFRDVPRYGAPGSPARILTPRVDVGLVFLLELVQSLPDNVAVIATGDRGSSHQWALTGPAGPGRVLAVPLPQDLPVDVYRLSIQTPSGRIEVGDVSVGIAVQAEDFVGVTHDRARDPAATPGWSAYGQPIYQGREAAIIYAGSDTVVRALPTLPPDSYELRLRVYSHGGAAPNAVRIELTGPDGSAAVDAGWQGGASGVRDVVGRLTTTKSATTVSLTPRSFQAGPLIVDAIAIAPVEYRPR